MSKICITNRHLVSGDYIAQIKRACEQKPTSLILREKDLVEADYRKLAREVMVVCQEKGVECILHHFREVARECNCPRIHLSFSEFMKLSEEEKNAFDKIGVSTHSVEEAVLVEQHGGQYILSGHIFATDCKQGVPPRGLDFLQSVCQAVQIPVYAIGGIHESNAKSCIEAGAAGVCMMSDYMKM